MWVFFKDSLDSSGKNVIRQTFLCVSMEYRQMSQFGAVTVVPWSLHCCLLMLKGTIMIAPSFDVLKTIVFWTYCCTSTLPVTEFLWLGFESCTCWVFFSCSERTALFCITSQPYLNKLLIVFFALLIELHCLLNYITYWITCIDAFSAFVFK